ncbi:patatin-like phospholipase domain containing 3 isoform 2-T2 [Odontesthes bonariensis]|uniref:patatin-like phospholipase domain containing 3 isoform X2 n=1 Tax=Odontesthes bonariensis TaxID=219752 RepID=UPI003F58745E
MFGLNDGWNLSFAGCGFLGIYHIGVASCLLEKAPYLVEGATKLYGASAGALTASVLASQACIAKCCEDVLEVAKEARKRNLGPLHPTFNLALICSSFIPVYCGLIPPSFRGVRYVDGGISDNLPQSELKNTITISPFSGESDICPRDNSTSFHELRFTNTSIQMNMGNMYRLSRALFPPDPKALAEMCQSGYKDALRFLEENNLLMQVCPTFGPSVPETSISCCKSPETTREWVLRRLRLLHKPHWCLDEQIILPTPIKEVFCKACQDKTGLYAKVSRMLPMRVASYMLMPYTLPVQSAYSVAQRFVEWIPEVPADVRWLFGVAGDVYRQAWKAKPAGFTSEPCLRKCMSEMPLPSESENPTQNILPAFSSIELHSNYWEIPKPTSSSHHHNPPLIEPLLSSQPQVCFYVSSQDDLSNVQQ